MKLGAYYWDGWYAKISHWTKRLLQEFPDREPQWGWLGNTVENMELQIELAADAGLQFFAYDWYYPQNGIISGMNDAVDRYLHAKNAERMNFCLLVANHNGGYIFRNKWEDACRMFLPYLTNEHALVIHGKPAIIFFSTYDLIRCLGGIEETKKCLAYLQEQAQKAGLAGVTVIGCQDPHRMENGELNLNATIWIEMCKNYKEAGCDALTGYNYHRSAIKENDTVRYIYPYEELVRDHTKSWDAFANYSELPYMPIVIGGWDCRPWETVWEGGTQPHPRSCYSPDRTPLQVYHHVLETADWIKNHADTALEDLAIVYAWNENGEGGYIEPTIGDNGRILAAIKQALLEVNKK